MKFSAELRKKREKLGVSRGQLSIESGVSYKHLQRLEGGHNPAGIGIGIIIKISVALDWPIDAMAEIIEEEMAA